MSTRRDDSGVGVAVLFLTGLFFLGVWQFSQAFGLDMATGFSVVGRLLVLAIFSGIAFYCRSTGTLEIFGIDKTWPILVGFIWICCWPALDYKAQNSFPSFMNPDSVSIWWDTWYSKLLGFFGIIAICYLIKAIFKAIWSDRW